jgi:hypothetical protein
VPGPAPSRPLPGKSETGCLGKHDFPRSISGPHQTMSVYIAAGKMIRYRYYTAMHDALILIAIDTVWDYEASSLVLC